MSYKFLFLISGMILVGASCRKAEVTPQVKEPPALSVVSTFSQLEVPPSDWMPYTFERVGLKLHIAVPKEREVTELPNGRIVIHHPREGKPFQAGTGIFLDVKRSDSLTIREMFQKEYPGSGDLISEVIITRYGLAGILWPNVPGFLPSTIAMLGADDRVIEAIDFGRNEQENKLFNKFVNSLSIERRPVSVQTKVVIPSDATLYRIKNVSFRYPKTVEPSRFGDRETGPYKDAGFFDRRGLSDLLKGDFDYLQEIEFIDNSDGHIKSFGRIVKKETFSVGPYDVVRKTRDTNRPYDDSPWRDYPQCETQYHVVDRRYVFCDNSANSEVILRAIEVMVATFKVEN